MCFFFFNDTATTEIYTLSLHDALPIFGSATDGRVPISVAERSLAASPFHWVGLVAVALAALLADQLTKQLVDRKSTRLNSSHANISYAVFCLKKKKNNIMIR